MSTLKQAKTPDEIKKIGLSSVRQEYERLAQDYNKILDRDVLLCPCCGEFFKSDALFYFDKKYATNRYPICKRCIQKMVEQRSNDKEEPNETKESVQKVLQMMDKVYDDTFYSDCIKGAQEGLKESVRTSPFSTYITAIQSLPQWRGKTWKDSDFGDSGISINDEEAKVNQRLVKDAKKHFGSSYGNEDLMFLENQYEDFKSRVQVDSKSQEIYVTQICLQLLDIEKDRRLGKDVSNKLKSLDSLMNSANLQPKQNIDNSANDQLSFGQLIEKWENEKPIPEPSAEFADVDGIGKYIRVWFTGWLCKALGIRNSFSQEFEDELAKYSVQKQEPDSDEGNDSIYEQIFGSSGDQS